MSMVLTILRTKNRLMGALFPLRTAQEASKLFLTPRKHPLKAWEAEMESRGRRITMNDGSSAISWGDSERKILLVHGWESRATQMSGFVDSLNACGYQVIAIDGPAHGLSPGKQADPYMFSIAVHKAVDELGPFDGVIGHSMGGNAVATAVYEGLDIPKVVLISSPSSIAKVLQRFATFIGLPERSAEHFIDIIETRVGKPADELNAAENIGHCASEGLVVHDRSDAEIPFNEAVAISNIWKSSSLYETDGYGHRAIVRQPEVWQRVSQFFA